MKTVHERQEEQRQAKFELMRQQIKAGTLVVRKMTDEERAKYPARPQPEKSKSGRVKRPLPASKR